MQLFRSRGERMALIAQATEYEADMHQEEAARHAREGRPRLANVEAEKASRKQAEAHRMWRDAGRLLREEGV